MEDLAPNMTARHRYSQLETLRSSFLDRGRQCSLLTVPSILPPAGFNGNAPLPTPYQSLGARGARTLASKLLLSLFPQVPFFNYRIADQTLRELGEQRGQIETMMAARERAVILEMETSAFRPIASIVCTHLIVVGNILIHIPPKLDERPRAFRLDQYVVKRDAMGNLLEIVIRESVSIGALPKDVMAQLMTQEQYKGADAQALLDQEVDVYTHVYLDQIRGQWVEYQEVGGIAIPDSEGHYPLDKLPYLPLRLIVQPGEDYGRSYVEEYLGDLDSLEKLTETLVEGSAASARVVFMVKPGGMTSLQVVAEANNGDVISGNAEDVSTMQVQKSTDLSVAKATADEIATRLSYAFMLHSSVQRSGERVTAEEIRYMAAELDDALGGVYTLLAADFQLPVVKLYERRMEKRHGVTEFPEEIAQPVIVAGLEAIGRGHEQQNLRAFVADILQVLGPEMAMQYLNPMEFMKRSAAAYNLDTEGLIPSEEQIQQREQMMQLQSLIQHLGPQAIQQLGGAGQQVIKQSMQTPPEGGQ